MGQCRDLRPELRRISSVRIGRIVKGEAQKIDFSGDFLACAGPFKLNQSIQCHAGGGRNKGGRKQMRANANKRRETLTNASKRRGEKRKQTQRRKREQTWTNANRRLHPPLLRFFTPPLSVIGALQKALEEKKLSLSLKKSIAPLLWHPYTTCSSP